LKRVNNGKNNRRHSPIQRISVFINYLI
jgi:hypothetical protein